MAVIDGMSINGNAYDLRDKVAVRFNESQSLTDAQKAQGRQNIGAAGSGDLQNAVGNSVHVNEAQSLTDAQKATARGNVGAASQGDLSKITEVIGLEVDKNTCVKLTAFIDVSQAVILNSGNTKTLYFACQADTAYTVKKVKSARFRVGYTSVLPAVSVAVSGIQADNDATSLTVTTGNSARYVVVYYYDALNDTLTENEIFASIQITYGTELTAVDKVARLGIEDTVKTALLNLVRHVAYTDDHGQDYYNALYEALYSRSVSYPRLDVVYAPGTHVVYTDESLDTLRPYLTVKRLESAQDTGTVVTDYTLSGTLVDGQSTVLVRKDGLAASVQVEAVDYYNIREWNYPGNLVRLARAVGQHSVGESAYVPSFNDLTSNVRNVVAAERGLTGMDSVVYVTASGDQYQGDSGYYLVPVPVGCNAVVAYECTPSVCQPVFVVWHYDGNNNWTRLGSTGYITSPQVVDLSQYMAEGETGYYVNIGFKLNSAGSVGENIQGFSLTFGEV